MCHGDPYRVIVLRIVKILRICVKSLISEHSARSLLGQSVLFGVFLDIKPDSPERNVKRGAESRRQLRVPVAVAGSQIVIDMDSIKLYRIRQFFENIRKDEEQRDRIGAARTCGNNRVTLQQRLVMAETANSLGKLMSQTVAGVLHRLYEILIETFVCICKECIVTVSRRRSIVITYFRNRFLLEFVA